MSVELWSPADESAVAACRRALVERDLAGALLAAGGATPIRAADARAELAAWSDELRRTRPGPTAQERATALRVVTGGLIGDERDYYDPRNVRLDAVIERGRGMPISLSAIWIVVGHGAGIPVDGVGLPGHFVVRVCGPRPLVVDPFHGGRVLTPTQCRALATRQGEVWDDAWLEAAPMSAIVGRVLRNLALCSGRVGDEAGRFRATRIAMALEPEVPRPALVHAHACEQMGLTRMAVELYEALALRFPGTEEAAWASRRAKEIIDDAPPLH